jgi:sec-independent protein translocase protein TatB
VVGALRAGFMIDFGFDKIALIGAVALIVIGPEKLPRVARTVGHLIGKAQRYVADVKADQAQTDFNTRFNGELPPNSGQHDDLLPPPSYRNPKKNWRLKRGATPQWYKARNGVRAKAQSGAARVARFRPPRPQA